MPRIGAILLLALAAACGDLTHVPPPPVPLTALAAREAGAGGDPAPTRSVDGLRLLKAAPPGALFSLHVPELASAARRFRETALYRILESREVRERLAPLTQALALAGPMLGARRATGGAAFDPTALLGSLRGEVVLCLEDVAGAGQAPRLLLLLGLAGAEREGEAIVELASSLAANDRNVLVERGTAAGAGFARIVRKGEPGAAVELAVFQGALMLGLGRETVTDAIDRASKGGICLADDEAYRRSMERCADPRDAVRLHFDVSGLLRKLGPALDAELARVLQALGADRIRGVAVAVRPDGEDLVVSAFLDSPGGQDVLTRTLARHRVDRSFLDLLPSDTLAFSLFALDGPALLAELRRATDATARAALEAWLRDSKAAGLDVERDLLPVFGPHCAFVTLPVDQAPANGIEALWRRFLGAALLVEVRDAAAARAVLARLPAATGSLRRTTWTAEEREVSTYHFLAGELPPGFSISYALLDGCFLLTLSEEAMRRMLAVDPGLNGARFRELTKEAPEEVCSLTYEDVRPGLRAVLRLLLPQAEPASASGGSLADALRTLRPAVAWTVADERGLLSVTRSPTGGFGSMGGFLDLATVAAITVPNFAAARIQSNEAAALTQLRAIHSAQTAFRTRAILDSDGDGEGEFAFLSELTGDDELRDGRSLPDVPLLSGLVRNRAGDYERSGYLFRAFLPSEDGTPIGGRDRTRRRQVDGDLAENVMVVLAWPVSKKSTGRRSFLMDGGGAIYACANGPYEGSRPPPPDVLSGQAGNLAAEPIGEGGHARDGFDWVRVR